MDAKIAGFLGNLPVGDDLPVRVVGVINLSPESFYKSSVVAGVENAVKCAAQMLDDGADGLDVGGMSTAPYLQTSISVEEEMKRLIPVLKALTKNFDVPISADTQREKVAQKALASGATIINDISSKLNEDLVRTVADHQASYIVLPEDLVAAKDVIDSAITSLRQKVKIATELGVESSKIIIDPGIGFIRKQSLPWFERDSLIIANLQSLRKIGMPILVGVSRKSFIGKILSIDEPEKRLFGTIAATGIAVFNGAHVIRTHDVAETRHAVMLASHLRGNQNFDCRES